MIEQAARAAFASKDAHLFEIMLAEAMYAQAQADQRAAMQQRQLDARSMPDPVKKRWLPNAPVGQFARLLDLLKSGKLFTKAEICERLDKKPARIRDMISDLRSLGHPINISNIDGRTAYQYGPLQPGARQGQADRLLAMLTAEPACPHELQTRLGVGPSRMRGLISELARAGQIERVKQPGKQRTKIRRIM